MRVTVEPKAAQEEDIFQPGKLVSLNSQVILVTKGLSEDSKHFCGVTISCKVYGVGEYDEYWSKQGFTKFVGKIVLEQ